MAIFWQNDFTALEPPDFVCNNFFLCFIFYFIILFFPLCFLFPWLIALVHFSLFNWAPDEFSRQGHSSCGSRWRTSPKGAGLTAPQASDAAWLWKFTYLSISAAISITSFVYPCHYHFSISCNHLKCRLLVDKWDRAWESYRKKCDKDCLLKDVFFYSSILVIWNMSALINLIFTSF